jgi:hypothetical protein
MKNNVLFLLLLQVARSESCVVDASLMPILQPVQSWKIVEFYKNWFAVLVVVGRAERSSDYLVGLLVGNSRLLLFLGERYSVTSFGEILC